MKEKKIRTAVVGAGKMGTIHARLYSQLAQSKLIGIVDQDKAKAKKLARKYKCDPFDNCNDILDKVEAVTIATPTVTHLDLASPFIENGIAVMIEKPLASTSKQGIKLVEHAKKHNTLVAVGHSERCNPVVQAIKRLKIEPKFIEATRISPYPFRSTDIGVVHDIMIHDIDIILSLAGREIEKVDAVGVNVIDEQEDICNARIVFKNGCIANITASRLALKTERKVRVFSKEAYLSVDYLKRQGTVIKADPNTDIIAKVRELKKKGKFGLLKVNWPELLHIEKLDVDDKEPLRVEQESFLRAVADKDLKPEVSAEEGLAAVKCAELILDSVRKHKWV
ncbi:MAG: Gfo/Idh/MocA family oxidoreductase [Sedimentisphaerales bacterium]|nr:Gfo/Idh/MocA family oxidoreductase [Sedimentisphaerales bacterium]